MIRFKPTIFFALLFLQACQWSEEANVEKIAKENKRNDAAAYNTELGLSYLKQGNRPRAKKKLLIAMELAPSSPNVNSALAYYFEKTGEADQAQKYYNKALALAPESGAQLNNYGTFLCRLGKYEDSEVYFLKAVKDVNYIHTAAALENAGLCASAIPNYKKATSYFIRALEQDPQRKQSLYELASIEIKEKHPEIALSYLQKYKELSLNDSTLLAMAIVAAHKTGQTATEAEYQLRLSKFNNLTDYTGVKNEHDNNNG